MFIYLNIEAYMERDTMNMFALEYHEYDKFTGVPCPMRSAKSYCDKHMKILVEVYQMAGSACIRHGATPDMMPLNSSGKPLRGGYAHHPMTKWIGESRSNYIWAMYHGATIAEEYFKRYNKTHFCEQKIEELFELAYLIPEGDLTTMPRCFNQSKGENLDLLDEDKWPCVVEATREFYFRDKRKFAVWGKGRPAPAWWMQKILVEKLREAEL